MNVSKTGFKWEAISDTVYMFLNIHHLGSLMEEDNIPDHTEDFHAEILWRKHLFCLDKITGHIKIVISTIHRTSPVRIRGCLRVGMIIYNQVWSKIIRYFGYIGYFLIFLTNWLGTNLVLGWGIRQRRCTVFFAFYIKVTSTVSLQIRILLYQRIN